MNYIDQGPLPLVVEQAPHLTDDELKDRAIKEQKEIDDHHYHELEHAIAKREAQNRKLIVQYRHALQTKDEEWASQICETYLKNEGIRDAGNLVWELKERTNHQSLHCGICTTWIHGVQYEPKAE